MTHSAACAKARKRSLQTADGLAYVVFDETAGEIDRTFQPWTDADSEELDTFFCGIEPTLTFERGRLSE